MQPRKKTLAYLCRKWINPETLVAVQCYPYNFTEVCEFREEESVMTGDLDCVISQFCSCIKGSVIAQYIFEIGPLLYPFTIEFRELLNGKLSFYVLSRYHFITQ